MRTHSIAVGMGLLLALDAGMILKADAASVTFEFKPAPGVSPDYEQVSVWLLPDKAAAYWDAAVKWTTREPAFRKTFTNLEPGDYYYLVFTGRYEERWLARTGAFSTHVRGIELTNAAAHEIVTLEYRPITNLTFFRGPGTRSGRVVDQEGQPVAGERVRIATLFDGQGVRGLYAFDAATTGRDGGFRFTNVNPAMRCGALTADFDFAARWQSNEVVVVTKVRLTGKKAAAVAFKDLGDSRERKLSEFLGKPVVIEFWASTCGPCQAPGERFQGLYEAHPKWRGRVELIALSLDHTEAAARQYIARKNWNRTRIGWAGEGGWEAPAARRLHVSAIPCLFVIDARGIIAEAGDPRELKLEEAVAQLLRD